MRKKQMAIVLAMILSAQAVAPAAAEDVILPETVEDAILPETVEDALLPEVRALDETVSSETEVSDEMELPETEAIDEIAPLETGMPVVADDTADGILPEMAAEEELIIEPQEEVGDPDSEIPEELAALMAEPAPAADTAQAEIALSAENFPDAAFCTYLEKFDADANGSLSAEEIKAVEEIDVIGKGIRDLTGVEKFTALTRLYCDNNQLTALDVSQNKRLSYLQCSGNQITALNLQNNTSLVSLVCSNNQISALDISKNTRLQDLRCAGNLLAALDISNNKSLAMVDCSQNAIAELNAAGHTSMYYLWCSQNQLTSLDVSGDTKLQWLDCSQNQIASLTLTDALNVYATQDSALNILNCADNRLTSLDVSGKEYLKGLICDNNELTELDISTNTDLRELHCSNNALTSLHVMNPDSSGKVMLQQLDCSGNQLTSLDLRYLYITETNILPNCSGQNFAMELIKTENGCQVDLNPFIGDANLLRLTREELLADTCKEKSKFGNVILLTQEGELKDGVLTFTEEIPETIELVCATGYQKKAKETDVLLEINLHHMHDCQQVMEKEPGCTENGVLLERCGECGIEIRTAIPAKGHSYEEKKTAPTCTKDGVLYDACTACGAVKEGSEQPIPATGHSFAESGREAATCTQNGVIRETCAACGEVKETAIPATGHSYGAYQVTLQPTIFADGRKTRTCSVCGDEQSETLPKLPGTVSLKESSLPVQVKKNVTVQSLVTGLQEGDAVESWKSGDESILTITDSGKLNAKKTGQTSITVVTKSGATTTLTVKVQKEKVSTEKITGLSKNMTLTVGKSLTLKPVITPISSQDKVTYATSNKKIATVSQKGVVKGVKAGTAKITVKSGSKKFQIKIKVSKPAVKALKNVPKKKTVKVGKTFTIKPKLSPTGSSGKVTYKSSNKKVAAVSAKGKVSGKKKGTAVITVSVGKIKVKCKVTVK